MLDVIWENCQNKTQLKDEFVKTCQKAAEAALTYEGHEFDAEVTLIFTDDEEIREINNENRGIDRATDVLSFPMLEAENSKLNITPGDMENGRVILGDIVISLERAEAQAKEYGHSLERELGFLTVHSMLHLLGYDHENGKEEEKIMFEKQENVLSSIGLMR